jgi:Carboxypeptidase regulatory-like domain
MRHFRYGCLVLMACAITSPANGRSALGILAGIVLNAAETPVANASVTVQTSDGLHPHATRTDTGGRFRFTRFERGQYDLRAATPGAYSKWSKRIVVRSGKTTEVVLRLTK